MLIVFAVVAIWLSTIAAYPFGDDVRHAIALLIVIAFCAKAFCSSGRQRFFWFAFSFVLLVAVIFQGIAVPQMMWLPQTMQHMVTSVDVYGNLRMPGPSERRLEAFADTVRLAVDFILAAAAGFIALHVCDQSRAGRAD